MGSTYYQYVLPPQKEKKIKNSNLYFLLCVSWFLFIYIYILLYLFIAVFLHNDAAIEPADIFILVSVGHVIENARLVDVDGGARGVHYAQPHVSLLCTDVPSPIRSTTAPSMQPHHYRCCGEKCSE